MQGIVEQNGLYQNCKFHDPWGRASAPMVGPNLVYVKAVKRNIVSIAIDSKLKLID
jgi:hypothetical protein